MRNPMQEKRQVNGGGGTLGEVLQKMKEPQVDQQKCCVEIHQVNNMINFQRKYFLQPNFKNTINQKVFELQ